MLSSIVGNWFTPKNIWANGSKTRYLPLYIAKDNADSDNKLIRYQTYQITNLSDTKLIRYQTYQILSFQIPTTYHWELGGGEGIGVYLFCPQFCRRRRQEGWQSLWAVRRRGDRGWPVWSPILPQDVLQWVGGHCQLGGEERTRVDLFDC